MAKKAIKKPVKKTIPVIEKDVKHDIVKDSTKLRDALKSRWKEIGWTQAAISVDAIEHGQEGVTRQAINKYLRDPYAKGALNQQQIVWLAWRWYIPVTLGVGIPNGTVSYTIPEVYDEDKALRLLKKALGK